MIAALSKRKSSFAEFVIIMSLMMSLTALSIDAMLPALPDIAGDLAVQNTNNRQLVVSVLFLGLAVGQMLFGPLSDNIGRKPAVYLGYALYILGSLVSVFAPTFTIMLGGRLLQGLGVSAPRALTLAIVRDRYEGDRMAQVMSFVMTVFILVPMFAPALGEIILIWFDWRAIFVAFIVIAIVSVAWFALRVPESLPPEHKAPFSLSRIIGAVREIVRNRTAFGYTLSAGLISGAFLGYLNSSQQIFQDQYGLDDLFAVVFAVLAFAIGLASLSNSRLVMRFGMRFLVINALRAIVVLSLLALGVAFMTGGNPPFLLLMAYLMLTFFGIGILFGNQNSLAMQPLGHLAGIGAAVVGSLSTFIMMPLGTVIGQSYDNTLFPLIIGMVVLSFLSLVVVTWVESAKS